MTAAKLHEFNDNNYLYKLRVCLIIVVMAELKVTLIDLLAFFIFFCSSASRGSPPPVPVWPDKFTINFDMLVEEYGDDWKSTGTLYYDYNIKVWL